MAQTFLRRYYRTLFLAAAVAYGLSGATPAAAQTACPLRLTATQVPVEQLTIADFDINNFESRGLLFTVNIANPGPDAQDVQMDVVLNIALATGENFFQATIMKTDPFTVPVGGRTITNLDLGKNAGIGFETFDINDEARHAIEDRALSSGMLPAGVYTLSFTLENCADAGTGEVRWDLTNPSRVDLISPQDGEGVSEYPFFEFYHQGLAARLTVAELDPGQTYEDAIDHDPPMLRIDLGTEQAFLYHGGRPLEQGTSYVWRVQSLVRVAGGTDVDISSPVRSFTVSEGGSYYDALLARLEAMYGSEYPDVFRAIREGGYRPTGEYALDGSALSEADLLKVLDALQQAIDSSELTFE
jgi:hypothetical protein